MDELALTYRGTVYPWQCDHVGHMNVMWYVGRFDEATWQAFSRVGLTPGFFRESRRGMAAVEQRIQYRRELHAGDVISIRSGIVDVREKSITLLHAMERDESGELAARTIIVGVHLDLATRRAIALPEAVRETALRARMKEPPGF